MWYDVVEMNEAPHVGWTYEERTRAYDFTCKYVFSKINEMYTG